MGSRNSSGSSYQSQSGVGTTPFSKNEVRKQSSQTETPWRRYKSIGRASLAGWMSFLCDNSSAKRSSTREIMASRSSPSKTWMAIQKLMYSVYYTHPDLEIKRIDTLPPSPHKTYVLTTASGDFYMLKTLPPSGTRLMRRETKCPTHEIHVINLLKRSGVPIPRVFAHDSSGQNNLGAPYVLRDYLPGVSLKAVAHKLTSLEVGQIDYRIGNFMRIVNSQTQPQFGLASKVMAGKGCSDWRTAFHKLFESVLRDAEDVFLSLHYESIRGWMNYFLPKLDVVREARLVPLRSGSHNTIIMDEGSKTILGIVGWEEVVWGDPALGESFENPSASFWHGYGGTHHVLYGDGYDEVRQTL